MRKPLSYDRTPPLCRDDSRNLFEPSAEEGEATRREEGPFQIKKKAIRNKKQPTETKKQDNATN